MAVDSHAKAVHAQRQGLYAHEIVPVHTTVKDKEGKEQQVSSYQSGPFGT